MGVASQDHTVTGVIKTDADWVGTLKRGSSFTLGINPDTSLRFVKGEEYPLDDDTKLRLEEKAIDRISTGDEDEDGGVLTEPKCKFDFRRSGDIPKSAPRSRVRAR